MFRKRSERAALILVLGCGAFFLSGCWAKYSYPADKVPKAVEDICKKEYSLDTRARVVGRTIGVVTMTDSLKDAAGQVSPAVHDLMGKVMQVVTRVALSTDLPLDYVSVIVRDIKSNQQLSITRSMDDTRRAQADMIGIEESINRTLFGQSAYKRLPGAAEAPLVLKDVRKEDFLAAQIAQRIRFAFAKDKKEEAAVTPESIVLADGHYDTSHGHRTFVFAIVALSQKPADEILLTVFDIIDGVLDGYKFTSFDRIEVQDYLNRRKLVVDRQTLMLYRQNKLTDEDLLNRCVVVSPNVQDSFKLIEFALPKDPTDVESAAAVNPTATL